MRLLCHKRQIIAIKFHCCRNLQLEYPELSAYVEVAQGDEAVGEVVYPFGGID
jgi:hypothetical protein